MKLQLSITFQKHLIAPILFTVLPIIGCNAQYNMTWLQALEDSEVIFTCGVRAELKKGSKIIHPKDFNGKDVNIILSGEASFEVLFGYHLSVEYDEIVVKATGTSFSITEGNGTIEVSAQESEILMVAN